MSIHPHPTTELRGVWREKFAPVMLKELMLACDISQTDLATGVADLIGRSVSRATVNVAINRGYLPTRIPEFGDAVEQVLKNNRRAQEWLDERDLHTPDVWRPLGRDMRRVLPSGHGRRTRTSIAGHKSNPAIVPGNPHHITINWEVEMIGQDVLKYHKIFRNPFIDDIQKDTDVYMSEEHRYIEAAMLDAARHGGFLAVIGEVGSGKSVMRRKVIEHLKREGNTLVIYPQTIDKTRLTAASICDAIIQDISSQRCKVKLEAKSRQVRELLLDRAKSGYRAALVIEEAHDLNVNTLKYLKRFYELEDGYRKLLGIILIGQTELKHTFNESTNVDMREVIRRVQIAEIRGLNGHLAEYLSVKFKRVGKDIADLFGDGAIDALGRRLTSKSRDGKRTVSHAYPLLVNNYVARAMNLSFEMGEPMITADVVNAI